MRRGAAQHRGEGLLDRDDLDRMLMRDERANKDQESRAIRAIRARPGFAARGAQLPAKYHNGAVVLQHPELLFPHHVSRHIESDDSDDEEDDDEGDDKEHADLVFAVMRS